MSNIKESFFSRRDHEMSKSARDFNWGGASHSEFKRKEMQHELGHETNAPTYKKPKGPATGMIYHPKGSKVDKNGKKYDFHHGFPEHGQEAADKVGGKFHAFKPKTLKEFVMEADEQIAPMKLSGKVDKVQVDPDISELADADDESAGKVETT